MPNRPKRFVPLGAKPPDEERKARHREYERHRARNPKLALSKRLRNSVSYIKFRKWFKGKYPLCADPFGRHVGRPTAMLQVHHIEGLVKRPDLLCSTRDCAGLCAGCHGTISQMERDGKDTTYLFTEWRARVDAEPLAHVF